MEEKQVQEQQVWAGKEQEETYEAGVEQWRSESLNQKREKQKA